MNARTYPNAFQLEVQSLVLTGFKDACVRHLLLRVKDAGMARQFIGELVERRLLAFGDKELLDRNGRCPINIGFSCEGLYTLGAPKHILALLKERSPAFGDGAIRRAGRYLGDGGRNAPDQWEGAFFPQEPHVWISIHGPTALDIDAEVDGLRALNSSWGLTGWDAAPGLSGQHIFKDIGTEKQVRVVPFGFRDSITRPHIGEGGSAPAGELLLGFKNIDDVDLWTDTMTTPPDIADFLRHGSFGILRKIEQFETQLEDYLQAQAARLRGAYPRVTAKYLKAKMCGRWPNGALVKPGEWVEPKPPGKGEDLVIHDFEADRNGLGCPFGAHIRRANPHDDPIVSLDLKIHTLFRRGVPYPKGEHDEAGLLGVFFCARIEDHFERLVSEWLEKKPMGPPNPGRSKDPLVGNHDDPAADFLIPQRSGAAIALTDFSPFVRTRGTVYALFPSLQALKAMTAWRGDDIDVEASQPAAQAAPVAPPAAPVAALAAQAAPPAQSAHAEPKQQQADAGQEKEEAPKPDFMDVPTDRFCDVVMEGGITSGVIYASAAVELGRNYRFRSIGGSSIGAFAAALSAAAEYWRRKGSGEGFTQLEQLPKQLAEEVDGRTLLERLFIPQKKTRRLFKIFLASLDRENLASLAWHGFVCALRQYRKPVGWTTLVLLALTLAGPGLNLANCLLALNVASCFLGFISWGTAAVLALVLGVFGALLTCILLDVAHGVVPNGFGLCRGWRAEENPATIDLAGFLHASIQHVAGRHPKDDPLTFEDLWNAPGSAAQALDFTPFTPAAARSINLEVYSSNLAHSRPYRFPLDEAEDMGRLFFRAEELEYYFPKRVVRHMQAYAKTYKARSAADPPADSIDSDYLELPVGKLPIVVAVRLAMSFPLLISAVPLYAIDHERRSMAQCWMSDGGLCSNFPIHLFDSFVPRWPTFGISLQARRIGQPEPVSLPEYHTSGRGECWDLGPSEEKSTLGKFFKFLFSLWKTTWRWNDSTMMRMPGVRDRVVRVYLEKDEGGVNIRMKAPKIRRLGECYGKTAAAEFIRKFAQPDSKGWEEHRWVRLNCMLLSLRERIEGISGASELDRHAMPLTQQIAQSLVEPPLRKPPRRTRIWPSETALRPEQARELKAQLEALCALEGVFADSGDFEPYRAMPQSSMRIRHPT